MICAVYFVIILREMFQVNVSHFFSCQVLKSSVDLFYSLCGVPDSEVQPPKVTENRVFIQSTSHGARCLKRGATILYKV